MSMKQTKRGAGLLTAAGLISAAGVLAVMSGPAATANSDPYAALPETIVLSGTVRDFQERSASGGHPDFERRPNSGFGHYMGNVAMELDEDDKPVFDGGGYKVAAQWKDPDGRPIHPSLWNAETGGAEGRRGKSDSGGITSAQSFAQWFRNVPGVNMASTQDITLKRQSGSNLYVFDDRHDENFSGKGGFFPINGRLFGNSAGNDKNFHFTYELATTFTYEPGTGQTFKFRGDDDVFVFINGRMVIDIGGVHGALEQNVNLDELDFVEEGPRNTLHFFFAERHRTQSNFRLETTIQLRTASLPTTFHMYD
ncbi:MAG: fibro-slime domain-containing protein [Planctomycetota bacterium]